MSLYASGVYRPTITDMKLPDTRSETLSRFSEVPGLKRYESSKDAVIEYNVAADIATGTGPNISKAWQKTYGNVSFQGTANLSFGVKGHSYFSSNISQVGQVFLPNS